MGRGRFIGPALALLLVAGGLIVLLNRKPPPEREMPPLVGDPVPRPPTPAARSPLTLESRKDPQLDRWYAAILKRDAKGVMEAQTAFLSDESKWRAPLERLATEEPDARIRAFSVAMLGRFRQPPPESFFTDRLADREVPPRLSALAALDRLGTRASLEAVERAAAEPQVKAAADRVAARLRAK